MPIAIGDQVYEDELDYAVQTLPADIKRVFITSGMPLASEAGVTTPSEWGLEGSTEPADASNLTPGMETPGNGQKEVIRPVPYGLNPPEREVIPPREPDTSPVLFETKTGVKITERDIEDGMGLAGGFMGTMAGVKAKTMKGKLNDLGGAQTLEAQGKNVDEIFAKTGMFRGADGRWRFEIDDSKAVLDKSWVDRPVVKGDPLEGELSDMFAQVPLRRHEGKVAVKLGEVLDHPDLYAAYPQLKNVDIVLDPKAKASHAWFEGNEIVMAAKHAQDTGILMHEVQHMIQAYEGFAKGGSPMKAATDYRLKFQKDFEALKPEMEELYNKWKLSTEGKAVFTKKEVERLQYLSKVASTYKDYVKAADEQAMEYYYRLAGETEARNVDARLLLKEPERRSLHPKWTEDVDIQNQIPRDEVVGTTAYGLLDSKGHVTKPR